MPITDDDQQDPAPGGGEHDLPPELKDMDDDLEDIDPSFEIPSSDPDFDEGIFSYGDNLASEESAAFASETDLEGRAKLYDFWRIEDLRDALKTAAKGLFMTAASIVEVAMIFWAWHLLMPKDWAFLDQTQLDKIQNILTAIILSGLSAGYAKRVMDVK